MVLYCSECGGVLWLASLSAVTAASMLVVVGIGFAHTCCCFCFPACLGNPTLHFRPQHTSLLSPYGPCASMNVAMFFYCLYADVCGPCPPCNCVCLLHVIGVYPCICGTHEIPVLDTLSVCFQTLCLYVTLIAVVSAKCLSMPHRLQCDRVQSLRSSISLFIFPHKFC